MDVIWILNNFLGFWQNKLFIQFNKDILLHQGSCSDVHHVSHLLGYPQV